MTTILTVISWVSISLGCFLVLVGALGMVRFPDFFTRLHAASITDTMGAALLLLGLLCHAGSYIVGIKLVLVMVFLVITGPTATHALAKAALHGKMKPWSAMNKTSPETSNPDPGAAS